MHRVRPVFNALHSTVRNDIAPGFKVGLREGHTDEFPKRRNMAYCMKEYGNGRITIVCAPKLNRERMDTIEGVLCHEFGHAILFHYEQMEHGERDADKAAEVLFGRKIRYDDELIQSTTRGVHPRPAHLGM